MAIYTASVDYSLDGGNIFNTYYLQYTGSLSTNAFIGLMPISGSKSAIFRSYVSGTIPGAANSYTEEYYVGGTQIKFTSYYSTHEYKYMCVSKRGEFNKSLNPTLFDSSGSQLVLPITTYDSATSESIFNMDDSFTPYATAIGLYDDANQLVAYAKFANPIKIQKDFDSVFVVKFDV